MQKEFKQLKQAIHNWVKKNKGEVSFIGSFCAFDKNGDVADNMLCGFGDKEGIEIALDEINRLVKKEKGFINW